MLRDIHTLAFNTKYYLKLIYTFTSECVNSAFVTTSISKIGFEANVFSFTNICGELSDSHRKPSLGRDFVRIFYYPILLRLIDPLV